jgi:hypothetical protein
MDIAAQYAKALSQIEQPSLKNLRSSLESSGRIALLPRIFAEYQKILLKRQRSKQYAKVTPEGERTRILLDLYRTLVK